MIPYAPQAFNMAGDTTGFGTPIQEEEKRHAQGLAIHGETAFSSHRIDGQNLTDFRIVRWAASGDNWVLRDHMDFRQFGHGVDFAVTVENGNTYMWVECNPNQYKDANAMYGTQIAKIQYVPSSFIDGTNVTGDVPGCRRYAGEEFRYVGVSIDPTDPDGEGGTGTLVFRAEISKIDRRRDPNNEGGTATYYEAFRMSDPFNASISPAGGVLQPAVVGQTWQGFTHHGNWIYILSGMGGNTPNGNALDVHTTLLDVLKTKNGAHSDGAYVKSNTHGGVQIGLSPREPEGFAYDTTHDRLVFGLTTGSSANWGLKLCQFPASDKYTV